MNLRERWRIAGTIAQEIRFHGYLEANPSNLSRIKENPDKIISQIKRSASINSFLTSIIVLTIGGMMVASLFLLDQSVAIELHFAISIGIFFGIGFVLIFVMNLMSTTGFFSAGAMLLPSTLPFNKSDLEALMLLAFVRIFIAPIALILIIFPLLMTVVFGLATGLFVFAALAATSIIALGALIRVAGWFHSKSQSGDESVLSTIVRISVGLGMMVGMVVAYSAISFIPVIVEFIISISTIVGSEIISLLALVFPFSFGFVAAMLTYGLVFPLPTIIAASAASIIYLLLGLRSYQTSGRTLRSLAMGGVPSSSTTSLSPIDLHVSSQIRALIKKDFRVATRSLGSVMLLVFPFLMIFAILPTLSMGIITAVRSMQVLMVMGYATGFSGLAMIGLLGLDTQGASVYEGLPLRTGLVLNGKITIFAISYVITILIVFILLLGSSLISPFLLFIPLFQLPCAYSIGAAVGGTVYKIRGGGRVTAVNLVGDQAITFISLIVSTIIGVLPLVGYTIILLQTGNHLWSILGQLSIALLEALLLRITLSRILKD